MKNLITFLFMAIVVSGSIMISCNKNPETQNALEIQDQINLKEAPTAPWVVNVTCNGSCPNGSGCIFSIVGSNQFGQCDCEGCTLVVEFPDSENGDSMNQEVLMGELSTKDLFIKHLDNFVFKKFKTYQYGIKKLQFAYLDDSNYYIQYEIITDKGQAESVLYLCRNDLSDASERFEIDCSGACDDPSEICTEQFNFNPPSATCTCEGGCSMIVTKIPD